MSLATAESIRDLQQRVRRMEGVTAARTLPVLPGLAGLLELRTGTTWSVDAPSLALALLAGASRAGEWSGLVGLPDLGWAAATELGIDLDRMVSVPDPGEHWLSVTAALVDVVTVVVVQPPGPVTENQAARLSARLRQRDAALLVCGTWPRATQRLRLTGSSWSGLGHGHGHLTSRRASVTVETPSAAPRVVDLWLPADDLTVQLDVDRRPSLPVAEAG